VDLARQSDAPAVDPGFEMLLEIPPFATRHFCSDVKRHPRRSCNADCFLRTFVGCQPPEKGKVRSRLEVWAKHSRRQTVVDGTEPVDFAERQALVFGNRNEGSVGKITDHVRKTRPI